MTMMKFYMFKLYEKEVAEQKIIDVEKYVQSMSF